ncbi:MAG: hypothetical protein ABSF73_03090 [Terriglobia bacterium]|jgi:hypothetical protein
MTVSPDQLAFIRKHGVTRCPPAPSVGVFSCKHVSEQEMIRRMCLLPELPSPYHRDVGEKNGKRKGKSRYEL